MAIIKTTTGDYEFTQKMLFPGCHVQNREVAFENLNLINRILSNVSLHWGVAFGTLLGIVRDGDFIEWDEDTDLFILEEEENQFRDTLWNLKEVGFELIRFERAGLYSIWRKGEYVDFYVLRKLSEQLRYTSDGCFIFEKYITERKKINFKGIPLLVPQEVEDYFSLEYGNWQTPIRYYPPKVNFFKRLGMIMYCYFRLYSPDNIYYLWIKLLRSNDLRKFKDKCKKNGIYIDEGLKMKIIQFEDM